MMDRRRFLDTACKFISFRPQFVVMWTVVDIRTRIQFSLRRALDEIRDEGNSHLIRCSVVFLHSSHNLVPRLILFPVVPLIRFGL